MTYNHKAALVALNNKRALQSIEFEGIDSPFPWFGGKSKVASLVWDRFGNVPNYVEPFFGSGAVLLNRPHDSEVETINDADGFVSNFWRAIVNDPETVAEFANWPVNENDLHARHAWLVTQRNDLTRRLEGNPEFFDSKIAGWWCWGLCCWIGGGWCSGNGPWKIEEGKLVIGNKGRGVKRRRVHLGDKGMGVNRQRVHRDGLVDWFERLSKRLRRVRVCCGDWTRVLGPMVTERMGIPTGIFLDPPYDGTRSPDVYAVDSLNIMESVAKWCIDNGDNKKLRIALCGYEGSFVAPVGWVEVPWKAVGGYGSRGIGKGRRNAGRERIWFSPHCLKKDE